MEDRHDKSCDPQRQHVLYSMIMMMTIIMAGIVMFLGIALDGAIICIVNFYL